MRSFLALVVPALAAAVPVLFSADSTNSTDGLLNTLDGPDPNEIQIQSASFSGNGCPQGSVSTNISPDKTVSFFPLRLSFPVQSLGIETRGARRVTTGGIC